MMCSSSSSVGGGVARRIGKIGKRLSFPSAPSSWVCRVVESIQFSQDCRPKSKILYPYPRHTVTPLPPRRRRRFWGPSDKGSFFWSENHSISNFLESQIPQDYSDSDSNSDSACSIEIGKQYDVISLLGGGDGELFRLNGDREKVEVERLIGKNVVVLCAYVPLYWSSRQAPHIRDLPVLCTKAFSSSDDYEVVVVPKMRNKWATDEDAFDHFLSDFPSSWLAIPFSHPLRRSSVCNSLALGLESSMCLFVDHDRKVLLHDTPCGCHHSSLTSGADWGVPWWSHSRLDAILGCDPSDHVYNLIDPATCVSISELNDKNLLGLYFCSDGSFIRTLDLVHQECKSKGLDFEIVLIYLPSACHDSVNPQLFQDAVNYVLHNLNIHNWWVLPHDDFRCRRFKDHPQSCFSEDELIIVGPRNQFVDPYGKRVITCFGLDAYPFTVDHVVEKRYQEIRALTLQSLLGDRLLFSDYPNFDFGFTSCHHLRRTYITAQELKDKTILLYLDSAHSLEHKVYLFPLLEWYLTLRRTSSHFDVVFVDLDEYGDAPLNMPWLWCSFDPEHSAFLNNRFGRCLLAFDKDGHIRSLNAQHLLHSCDLDAIESYKGLRNDVFQSVQADFSKNGVDF